MPTPMETLRKLQERPSLQLVMGLGGAIVALFLAALIGAFALGDDDTSKVAATSREEAAEEGATGATFAPDESTIPLETTPTVAGKGTPTTKKGGAPTVGGSGVTKDDVVSTQGATRIGVTPTEIRWGLHAPKTFDGAPLNLAEDPLHGVDLYLKVLNDSGGVNGRKIKEFFADDRYTVEGGKAAGDSLINDSKVFFVSGTLGVDQIAQVANEASKRGVPYIAGGGSEGPFKDIGMYQQASSYDTHLIKLAQFLGKEKNRTGGIYHGMTKVGVTQLDTPYISPAVASFGDELKKNGMELVKVVKIKKPTEQTQYQFQIQDLRSSGAQIVVPAQDPISTSRMVAECGNASGLCPWKWSISDFAHESDLALTLMGGSWTGVRGLSGDCYYTSTSANCGAMAQARDQWIKAEGQESFNKDGQGGVAGYQVIHFWLKALRDIGPDPTREKLVAAIRSYDAYSDLVSAPITHKGSANYAHGAEGMVIFEATNQPGPEGSGNNFTWRQLTDGFVSGF